MFAWGANEYELAANFYFSGCSQTEAIKQVMDKNPGLPLIDKSTLRVRLKRMFPERFAAHAQKRQEAIAERNVKILAALKDNQSIDLICRSLDIDKRTVLLLVPKAVEQGHTTKWEAPPEDKMPLDYSLEGEYTDIGKLFHELETNECRFSIGKSDDGYRFCAAPAEEGKSYCRQHCESCRGTQVDRLMMYRAARSGQRMLERTHVHGTFDRITSGHPTNDSYGIRACGGKVPPVSLST